MSYQCKEFRQVVELLNAEDTYKTLRPGFVRRIRLNSSIGDNGIITMKYHNDYVIFDLHLLILSNLRSEDYRDFYIPYKFALEGVVHKTGTTVNRIEIESHKNSDQDPDAAEKATLKYNSKVGVSAETFIENLESELNGNYHNLTDVEKSYFLLQGNTVEGDLLISQFKDLSDSISNIGRRGIKRSKRFRMVEFAIGQWIGPTYMAEDDKLWQKIGAAMFNGAATFQMSQLYFGLIEMFIRAII